ncbi:hypothetical protein [Lysinibacillus sp. NPDC056232]|uniref:hypothetical protein n=1 Tax=Lysinibacillus sp. NPDC056232 TaxID=3345756 RepID=UPI0035DCA507
MLPQTAHRTPPGSFALRESEASATNVLSVAKAKRQQQMFYLCESEASATKRSVEAEINPSFCRKAILYLIGPLNFIYILTT